MNKDITKLILIVGLVYISVTQKKESTRNIMLIITGLLGFCMYTKVEGLITISNEEHPFMAGGTQFTQTDGQTRSFHTQDCHSTGEEGANHSGCSFNININQLGPRDSLNGDNSEFVSYINNTMETMCGTYESCPLGLLDSDTNVNRINHGCPVIVPVNSTGQQTMTCEVNNQHSVQGVMELRDSVNGYVYWHHSDGTPGALNARNLTQEPDTIISHTNIHGYFDCIPEEENTRIVEDQEIMGVINDRCGARWDSVQSKWIATQNPAGGDSVVSAESGADEVQGCSNAADGVDSAAYDISSITMPVPVDGLNVDSGLQCNTGYFGTNPTATCSGDGQGYTLDGCTPCDPQIYQNPVPNPGVGDESTRCGSVGIQNPSGGGQGECASILDTSFDLPDAYHITTEGEATADPTLSRTTEERSRGNYRVENLLCSAGHYGVAAVSRCSEAGGNPVITGCYSCPDGLSGGPDTPGNSTNITARCGTEVPDVPANCEVYVCRDELVKKTEFPNNAAASSITPGDGETNVRWGDSQCCEPLVERIEQGVLQSEREEACECNTGSNQESNQMCKYWESDIDTNNYLWQTDDNKLTSNYDERGVICESSLFNDLLLDKVPAIGDYLPSAKFCVYPKGDLNSGDDNPCTGSSGTGTSGTETSTEDEGGLFDDVLDLLGLGGD